MGAPRPACGPAHGSGAIRKNKRRWRCAVCICGSFHFLSREARRGAPTNVCVRCVLCARPVRDAGPRPAFGPVHSSSFLLRIFESSRLRREPSARSVRPWTKWLVSVTAGAGSTADVHPRLRNEELLVEADGVAVGHAGQEIPRGRIEPLFVNRSLVQELCRTLADLLPQAAEDATGLLELRGRDVVLVDRLEKKAPQADGRVENRGRSCGFR